MVPLRKLRHFAPQTVPERENRLLAFAKSPGTPGTNNDDENNVLNPQPIVVSANPNAKTSAPGTKAKTIGEEVKEAIVEAFKQQKASESAEAKAKKEEEAAAAEAERARKAQEEMEEQKKKKREARIERIKKIADNAKKQIDELETLKMQLGDKGKIQTLRTYGTPELLRQWEALLSLVDREIESGTVDHLILRDILCLAEGTDSANTFVAKFKNDLETSTNQVYGFKDAGLAVIEGIEHDPDRPADITDALLAIEASSTSSPGSEEERLKAVEYVLERGNLNHWMTNVEKYNEAFSKGLEEEKKWVERVEKSLGSAEAMAENEANDGILEKLRGMRFYSVLDYYNAAKKYWDAVKKTWDTRGERHSADIAGMIGRALKFIPIYGTEVDRILDQELESKRSEETEAMKKYLERKNAKWEDLFGAERGEFKLFARSNPNKARGILEYAAEHGFLYDIDDAVVHGSQAYIYGVKLSSICSDWQSAGETIKINNYFTTLRGKNSQGREHEMEHGYKKEFDCEFVPRFIELLEEAMDEHNLWEAAGICKRAMERGFQGEVAAWLFTTIMGKLRQYPELRKVTPVSFFDIVGKLSMYTTAFTLGLAKGYRKELREWAKSGGDQPDESILERKTQLHRLKIIEDYIKDKSDSDKDYTTPKGKTKMRHLVAQVLAGQIVELDNGNYIHIYETKFNAYRGIVKTMFFDIHKPLSEDPDFATQTTEKSMLTEESYKKILAYRSQFDYENASWTLAFMSNLLTTAEGLSKIPQLSDAYTNYIKEVRPKFDAHIRTTLRESRFIRLLETKDPNRTGKSSFAALVAGKLISWDVIKKASYIDTLKIQLKDEFPDFWDGLSTEDKVIDTAKVEAAKKGE